jgi:hypothetical protein
MGILCAIPSRSNEAMLSDLLNFLQNNNEGIDRVVVYDNGYESQTGLELMKNHGDVIDARGWRFYSMWNHAWMTAHEDGHDAVALLNDDIRLASWSLPNASTVLNSRADIGVVGLNYNKDIHDSSENPQPFRETRGTYKDGGIWGCAFIVKSSTWGKVPPIDEGYWLWYGDDELLQNMNRSGYVCGIANNAPVYHEASVTTNMFPDLLAKTNLDRDLYLSKFT